MAEGNEPRNLRTGEGTTASSNDGHIIYLMQSVKKDIVHAIRTEFDSRLELQRTALSKAMETMCEAAVERIAQKVTSHVTDFDGSRSSDLVLKCKKSSVVLEKFTEVAGNKQALLPFLQWTTLVTVVSFTLVMPGVREWIPDKVYSKTLAGKVNTICAASGLSAVLFSVKSNEAKTQKMERTTGQLWSFIFRSAIWTVLRNGILYAFNPDTAPYQGRKDSDDVEAEEDISDCRKEKGPPPAWLLSFGKKSTTIAAVNEAVDRLEGKDERGIATKKRKLNTESVITLDDGLRAGHDAFEENRFKAVKQMRSNYMTMMNHGRTEVRAYLFEELLFLTEKISQFPTVQDAKRNGFEIVFEHLSTEEEGIAEGSALKGSIWDVPNATTLGSGVSAGGGQSKSKERSDAYAKNESSMKDMQLRFPSLYVTLKYLKTVQRPGNDAGVVEDNVTWPTSERISLHRVATGVLMEIFKAGSHEIVLSSSPYSLKAVHVIAIGLRGLLRKCMNEELSEIEVHALGDVGTCEVTKGESSVSVMMDKKPRRESKGPSRLAKLRAKKFSMTWAEYKEAKSREEEERSRRMAVLPFAEEEDEDSDDEIDHFFNTS